MAFSRSLASFLLAVFCNGQAPPSFPHFPGFTDIDPAKDRFCLVGDTQTTGPWEFWRERNNPQRKQVLAGILDRDPAFIIHLGDLTVYGSSRAAWREFDANHRLLRDRKIPSFPVLGNHEHYGRNAAAFAQFFGRFPHLERRFWYSFVWRNIGFIMLDSSFQDLAEGEREKQRAWFLGELARFEEDKAIDYVIACCHQPPFTNSRVIKASPKSREDFAGAFVRFPKAALFFSGHCHSYEKFATGGKLFIVSGGGGGPRHKVRTDPERREFADLYPGPELRFFHFCEVAVDAGRLVVIVRRLDEDGTFSVADTITIGRIRPPAEGQDQRRNP